MIHHGDCLDVMAAMEPESVSAVVTDPPYGLEFMGKSWDKLDAEFAGGGPSGSQRFKGWRGPRFYNQKGLDQQAFHARWAEAAYRVAKPSAYLLAFGGTRTVHRMTCAIEDAGWIIRDMLCWGFASGFPKSRASLKPAYEPIIWAQKPLSVAVQSVGEIHHALAALIWLTEGAPSGSGCASARVASLFDGSGPTGTSRSPAAASTSSSIVSSWARILAVASIAGSRSTTSTGTRLTTALRTLSSCLSPVTSATTMPPCGCLRDGSSSPALTAASGSSDEHTNMLATLKRSVPESAIGPLAQAVAGVCASIADDLSGDLAAEPTAPEPATTSLAERADFRPIVMARKPGPLAMLNIDGCRIGVAEGQGGRAKGTSGFAAGYEHDGFVVSQVGRWPANVILTDEIFDGGVEGVVGGGEAGGNGPASGPTWSGPSGSASRSPMGGMGDREPQFYGDSGTYSRFFLVPKSSRSDREPGVPPEWYEDGRRSNTHPTCKPTALMRHLVRLVTPTGGTVLDPFLGSGTTGIAAEMEGFPWIGIEREAEYVAIAQARLEGVQRGFGLPA